MDAPVDVVEEVVVEERVEAEGAVDRSLDRATIEAFPTRSADELLRALPGLHQSAHGGRGKAYQVFLRGFDAEHGTAVAVDLEGIPLNEVDNVHGHGYLDLHVVPDALVRRIDLHAGVPRAADGNFAVVGAASYGLGLERTGLVVRAGAGTDTSGSGEASWRPRDGEPGTFLHAEGTAGQGIGEGRAWRQVKAAAGVERELGRGSARAFLLAYDGVFDSPGALREEDLAVEGFYGAYQGAGGGASRRVLVSGIAETRGERAGARLQLWGGARHLSLTQNFTGSFFDAEHGDATRQLQDTLQGGGSARGHWEIARALQVEGGMDLRIDQGPSRVERIDRRERRHDVAWRADQVQRDAGAWAEVRARPVSWLTTDLGLRGDHFAVSASDPERRTATAAVLSPRGRAVVTPIEELELSAALGRGIVSPEARAVVDGARAPVTVADVAEVGVGLVPAGGLALRGAGFHTRLDDELVFDHTVGRYVSGGTTRRIGATGVAEWTPVPELAVLADVTWADGRFTTTDTPIPFAPRWLASGAVFVKQASVGRALVTAGLRTWYLGRRPLPSGFTSVPAVAADLTGRVEVGRVEVSLDIDNALGNRWRDGEFLYPSWWDRSSPRSERPVLHVTAGEPTAVRGTVGVRF